MNEYLIEATNESIPTHEVDDRQAITDNVRTSLKTQYEQIEWLLKTDERCRNDDKWLTWRLMKFYTNIYIPFEDFEKIPAFANSQKIRQKIQNKEGKYLPTDPEVIKRRNVLNKKIKEFMVQ